MLEKAALRETVNVGPSVGDRVVEGRTMADGAMMLKSGMAMTVPS